MRETGRRKENELNCKKQMVSLKRKDEKLE